MVFIEFFHISLWKELRCLTMSSSGVFWLGSINIMAHTALKPRMMLTFFHNRRWPMFSSLGSTCSITSQVSLLRLIHFRWATLRPKQGQFRLKKKESIIQYSYRNVELMQECFPRHSRMGTASKKQDKETKTGKKRGVSMEKCIIFTKKSPYGQTTDQANGSQGVETPLKQWINYITNQNQ